jgi:mannose-6-phosphate isomerase-like protein (cupin superfamily)
MSTRGAGIAIAFAVMGLALAIALLTAVLLPGHAMAQTTGGAADAVRYFPSADVQAAFDRGAVLLDAGSFMVHASRRDAAGMAEVHLKDTDIVHVLHGGATIVTGGTVVGGEPTAPDELRGASIDGGVTRRLAEGDVLVVPRGVPHWFREVNAPFLYYVVKVR